MPAEYSHIHAHAEASVPALVAASRFDDVSVITSAAATRHNTPAVMYAGS
jgi:hypothetical protein